MTGRNTDHPPYRRPSARIGKSLIGVALASHLLVATATEIPLRLPEPETPVIPGPPPPQGQAEWAALFPDAVPETLQALAALYQGRWQQALDLASTAIGQGSLDLPALGSMATAAAVIGYPEVVKAVLPKLDQLEQPPHFANLTRAIQALRAGDTTTAEQQLAPLTRRSYESPLVHYFQGELEQMRGDPAAALGSFRRAAAIAPRFSPALAAVARLLPATQGTEAIALMERAVAIDPNNAAYRRRLAELYARAGRREEANRLFAEALSEIPGVKEQYLQNAWQLQRSGMPEQARNKVERARGHWGTTALGSLIDAMASADLGEPERAKQQIQAYLNSRSDQAQAQIAAGLLFLALEQGTTAAEHFSRALQLQSRNRQAQVNLAIARQATGRTGAASETLGKARKAGENADLIAFVSANIAFARLDFATYKRRLSAARTLLPGIENLALETKRATPAAVAATAMERNLMVLMFLNQWYTQAILQADKILQTYPEDAIARYFRALSQEQQGKTGAALADLEQAVAAEPRFTGGYLALGRIALRTDAPRKAYAAYRTAGNLDPASLSARLGLARALLAEKKTRQAGAVLKAAEPLALTGGSLFQLGLAWRAMGDQEKFQALVRKALDTADQGAWRQRATRFIDRQPSSTDSPPPSRQ